MRRSVAVVLTSAALVGATLVPAHASTSTIVKTVSVDDATYNGGSVGTAFCTGTGFQPDSQTFMKVVGQADPNSSSAVSWAPDSSSATGTGWGVGPTGDAPITAADLQTLKVDVYNGPSGVAEIYAFSGDPMTNTVKVFLGRSAIPVGNAGEWATVDESDATYTWGEYSFPSMTYKAAAGTSTLATFAAAHPDAGYDAHLAFGCAGESDFAVQHLQWGAHVEDFGTIADTVTIKASAPVIKVGSTVTISGGSQYGGAAAATLFSKASNQTAYSGLSRNAHSTVIDDLVCAAGADYVCSNPFQTVTARPAYNTLFRWSYPGTAQVDGASSGFTGVSVRAVIGASFPTTIGRYKAFTVTGKILPARPGTTVTLWGKRGTSIARLATATVRADSTYSFTAKVGVAGTWSLYVTSPNDQLNAAGQSAGKTYSVR